MDRTVRVLIAVVILVALVGLPQASAIVIRADRSDSQYINLGSQSAYASVGQFQGTSSSGNFYASGTLIAPDWVLTAAHVVDKAKALNFNIGGQNYTADKWIANPGWNGNLFAGYDIGLVHLTKDSGVQPAALYSGASELDQVGVTVGYGKTGNGLSGSTSFDGRKRGAQNEISDLANPRLMISDFSSNTSAGALPLEGLIAPGDSGGGLFITTKQGIFLAGVNSFVGDSAMSSDHGVPDSGYGDIEGQTRVSAFTSWIEQVLKGAIDPTTELAILDQASSTADLHAEVVPEPSTLLLLSAAGLCLAVSRWLRRR
jgi:hypothetical protein